MENLTGITAKKARPARLFIILLLGSLMTVSPFSIDMYLPAFAQIATDLGSTTARIALSISSYFIGLAIGQIFYGPLLDRYGRKRPLYFGLTAYILACIGCIQSSSLEMLVILRFIQALGGGVALVATMAMVRDFFPVNETAKIISLLMLILGMSPLLAPTVGGFIATRLGWHWIFILLAIIVSLILLITAVWLPEGHEPDPGVSLKGKDILASFGSILKNRQFSVYSFAGSFNFAPIFIYVAGSPIIFMGIFHVSPEAYGGIFALLSVGFIGSNQINIFLLRKFSPRQVFRVGVVSQLALNLLFFFGAWQGWYGLTGTIVLFFFSLSTTGLTYPNASALALAPFDSNAGSASALVTFLQIGISALVSSCVGLLNPDNTAPLVAMMACASLIAFLIFLAGGRGEGGKMKAG